jgi:hypothetical protein
LNVISHPTWFGGVRFRSRLEAKWAAFFEMQGWRWEYEPLDLDGYVPDFVIHPGEHTPALAVEVKPLRWDGSGHDERQLELAHAKLAGIDWECEVLILGASVLPGRLGLIRDDEQRTWSNAVPFRCIDCGHASFMAEDGNWRCRANYCYDGKRFIDIAGWDAVDDFRRASSLVQWRPA